MPEQHVGQPVPASLQLQSPRYTIIGLRQTLAHLGGKFLDLRSRSLDHDDMLQH